MIKYLVNLKSRLNQLKAGMSANSAKWTGQPVTEAMVDAAMTEIQDGNDAIEAAQATLHEANRGGRNLSNKDGKLANQVISLAIGIHSTDPEKLADYGIKERTHENVPPPGKAVIQSVVKDNDGIGLVISIQPLANADNFDISRAMTEALVTNPPAADQFVHIKTTQKLKYTDDDVLPGKRYHYMVQGHNHNGTGEASAVVSAIE